MIIKPLPNLFDCKITVVGQGYVGAPLTVAFAESFLDYEESKTNIVGFDNFEKRLEQLKDGKDFTKELKNKKFNKFKNLNFTSNFLEINDSDIYIIAVPTPVDNCNKPDFIYLKDATNLVAKSITASKVSDNRKIIIFESTVYPGASEEICLPILEAKTGMKLNSELSIGYSPERVNPGDDKHRLKDINKLVSASDKQTLDLIYKLYSLIIEAEIYKVSSIRVAEAAKVVENIQRDLNIALVNELAIIFERLNISTTEVLNAAASKWNFVKYQPGLVGGHCIGVDPYYLTYKSEVVGYHPEVILAGRRINDSMSEWIATTAIKKYLKNNKRLSDQIKVLIMGFTYKSNCPDIRNTKVKDMYKTFLEFGCIVHVVDPYADANEVLERYDIRLFTEEEISSSYDIIVVAVAPDDYKNRSFNFWETFLNKNSLVVDVKGILKDHPFIWKL